MRFGLSLCPEVGRWKDTVEQARRAEELGYDSVWLPEHHLMAGYAPSPLLGLAGLVEVTDDILLGTDVLVAPFHNPARLAEDTAVLQEMSEGRFILGAALGYRPEEFAAFGVPFERRAGILNDTLQIVRKLWTEEDVSFESKNFKLDGVTIYPRLDDPPPLWVGGWVEAALVRAAKLGDAWFPGPTAEVAKVAKCLELYDQALAEEGKQRTELPIFREVWVAEDAAHMEAGVGKLRALYENDYVTWGHSNVEANKDIAEDRFIVGSPEEVAEQIAALGERLGVTHLVARLHFHEIDQDAVLEAMRLLSERVRPQVDEALAGV
jgi:alkanesulfonate monooxygenase SsuD/methylene tetrahydromethanopterin reductase-like flavin-dependent oxidoreductase (luciferase family)